MSATRALARRFGKRSLQTPLDGVIFTGLLVAEAPVRPGVCAIVAGVAAVALRLKLTPLETTAIVRRVSERAVALVDDPKTTAEECSTGIANALYEALVDAAPDEATAASVMAEGSTDYDAILKTFNETASKE